MQRTGRKGHAMFRVIVQDARRTPTSGNLVAALGHYDPHTKVLVVDKTKASFYLEHGAQPSPRIARLLKSEGIKLPKWVIIRDKKGLPRKPPAEAKPKAAPVAEAPAEEIVQPVAEVPIEPAAEEAAEPAEVTPPTEPVVEPEEPAPTEKTDSDTAAK